MRTIMILVLTLPLVQGCYSPQRFDNGAVAQELLLEERTRILKDHLVQLLFIQRLIAEPNDHSKEILKRTLQDEIDVYARQLERAMKLLRLGSSNQIDQSPLPLR